MPQIVVENLTKTFAVSERTSGTWGSVRGLVHRKRRMVHALDGISFSLEPGELVGYIGPNGAGKSTTVKVLSGILVPTSGRCDVCGLIPWKNRIAHVRGIGVVFGQRTQLWWDLPVVESFDLLRDIYSVPDSQYEATRDELIALLDLNPLLDTPVRQLSLGQRMRCDLAAALLHSPSIVFLDEPTIGLDAVSKLAVRSFVKRINRERGVTVILTTHDMDDIEALCSRVIVLGDGHILSDGTLDELRSSVTTERRLIVDLEKGDRHLFCAQEKRCLSPFSVSGVEVVRSDGTRVELRFDPDVISAADLIAQVTAKYAVKDLFVENTPIEEVIAKLYAEHRP